MINSIQRINCDECYGHGVIFYGDEDNYAVEPCECVANGQRYLLLLFARTKTKKGLDYQAWLYRRVQQSNRQRKKKGSK